jgi:hypothetical protein
MPLTLPAPTLSGKFSGSFAPLAKKSIFGANFSCTIALTIAKASSDWVPATTTSGLTDFIF